MTYIFTGNRHLLNALSLVWGVRSFYYDTFESTDQTIRDVSNILKSKGLVGAGDIVIHTASAHIQDNGRTNTIRLTFIEYNTTIIIGRKNEVIKKTIRQIQTKFLFLT